LLDQSRRCTYQVWNAMQIMAVYVLHRTFH